MGRNKIKNNNTCWKKLWPKTIRNSLHQQLIKNIVELAKGVDGEGFEDLQLDEVKDILASHQEELIFEDLQELYAGKLSEEEDEEQQPSPPSKPGN